MELEDKDSVVALIEKFHDESLAHHGISTDVKQMTEVFYALRHTSFVMEADGGIIGVFAGRIICSNLDRELVYEEMMWYMIPTRRTHGVEFLRFVEKQVKESGINKMVIAHLCDATGDRLENYYTHLGYKPLEVHYIREL